MKLKISYPAARSAVLVAAAVRVFYDLAVENEVHNGAWISALLGAVLALPLLAAVERLRRCHRRTPAVLTLLLCIASLVDSGLALSAIIRSSTFLAMDETPTPVLLLPVLLAMYWCVTRNGNAVGYGATLFSRIFPALLLLVTVLQWHHYRPAWLSPLLGNGGRDILKGSVRTACRFIPASALLLFSDGSSEAEERTQPAAILSCGAVLATLLLLLRLMMAPTSLAGDGWSVRLDTLLTNGRAPLYLQLPMIVLWYAGLLHLLACEEFAAALLLQRLVPTQGGRICALLATVGAAIIALSPLPRTTPEGGVLSLVVFIAAIILLLCAAMPRKAKGGGGSCA